MTYIVLFIVFFVVTVIALLAKNRKIEISLAVFLTILTIVMGTIRWKTGFDWYYYMRFYQYIKYYITSYSDLKISFEPLFTSFYFLAKATDIGFVLVQFLQIFIIASLKFSIYKRYTPYIVLAIFINFMMFPDIVTVRNFLAGAITLFSLRFVENKRIVPFFITILFAANFHASALAALLFYPIYHSRFSIGMKSVFLVLSIVVGFSGIFGQLLSIVGGLVSGDSLIAYKISNYSTEMEEGTLQETSPVIIILGMVRRLMIIPLIFFFEEKYFKQDKLFKGVSNLFIFGNVIYFIVGNDLRIFQRMSVPFYLCEVLLLVWIFTKVKFKSLFFAFLVLYGLSKYYYIYKDNPFISPFISIFDPETPQPRWDIYKPPPPFKE